MRRLLRVLVTGLAVTAVAGRAAAQGHDMPAGMHGEMEWTPTLFLLFDELEYAPGIAGRPVGMDAVAFYGGDINRVWLRSEGEILTTERGGEGEVELLYGRLVDPFWDALVGARVDRAWEEGETTTRALLSLGLQGLAPGWFEVAPSLFVSQHGDLSGRLSASYDLLLSQRLVVEPELELNVALQDVPEFGVGSGLNDIELGARMRYEIRRKFGPYLGVSWDRRLGETAGLARQAGEGVSGFSVVIGLRAWR